MNFSAMFSLRKMGSSHKEKKEMEAREFFQEAATPNIMSMLPGARTSRTNADMIPHFMEALTITGTDLGLNAPTIRKASKPMVDSTER